MTTLFTIVAYIINYAIIALIVMMFLRWILSWFRLSDSNPIMLFLTRCTEPVILPFRRHIPPVGGFDLSFLFAFVTLNIIRALLLQAIPLY